MQTGTWVGLGIAAFFLVNGVVGLLFGRVGTRTGVMVKSPQNAERFLFICILSIFLSLLFTFLALWVH